MLNITEISLELNRLKSGRENLTLQETYEKDNTRFWVFEGTNCRAGFQVTEENGILEGRIKVEIQNEPFRENDNLALDAPIAITLRLEKQPARMTAMYLHRDWWTRPAFIRNYDEMPSRTQCLYMELEKETACLLPLSGHLFKTMVMKGKKGVLRLEMTAYQAGRNVVEEPVFLLGVRDNIYDSIHCVFEKAAEDRALPLREKRQYPEMLEYLGWCSWDAFYSEITEEKVREKAREIEEKKVPVKWFLMDDGWLSVCEQKLYNFAPEKEKFPTGFYDMIQDLKKEDGIRWFGVWHAFGGYWGGIEKDSDVYKKEKAYLIETINGKYLPYPSAEKGYGFFRDWYEYLRAEGIDFVKVDGQSAVKNYYESQLPVCQAAKNAHEALEGATSAYMNGNLINCMGMAMENVFGRPSSGISRNSDDFVPDNPQGFAEHLLQNGYNALYHNELYHCDWDMFWTSHKDAKKHGILRAISGGPVYFSDRLGETDKKTVEPLVYSDGRILRMDRAGKPAAECVFQNPQEKGLLKITNVGKYGERKAGAIGIYNLAGEKASTRLCSGDIYDFPVTKEICYDWEKQQAVFLAKDESISVTLDPETCALYLLLPQIEKVTPVGLLEKYISFHAVESVVTGEHCQIVSLREGGTFGFWTEEMVKKVSINGIDSTKELTKDGNLWKIKAESEKQVLITIEW